MAKVGNTAAERAGSSDAAVPKGQPILASIFLICLILPYAVSLGAVVLQAHRVFLLIMFVPLMLKLLSGGAGKMHKVDWLIIGASFWTCLSLLVNHSPVDVIEPIGVHLIEFLGAYLVARVAIRSAADMQRLVKTMLTILLAMLPLAIIEGVTHKAVALELVGRRGAIVYADSRFGLRRAQTLFVHPIHYGCFAAAGLGLLWYTMRPETGLGKRLVRGFTVFLSTFLSLSTGAYFALLAQISLISWDNALRKTPARWKILGWGFAISFALLFMVSSKSPFHIIVHRFSFSSRSAYNRILIWDYGTNNIGQNPIFGLGLRDWERPPWMSSSMDNFWLYLAVFYGLPMILLLGLALFFIVRDTGRTTLHTAFERDCRTGYLITLAGIFIGGATVHYWHGVMALMMFLIGSGLWIVTGGKVPATDGHDAEQAPESGQRRRGWLDGAPLPAHGRSALLSAGREAGRTSAESATGRTRSRAHLLNATESDARREEKAPPQEGRRPEKDRSKKDRPEDRAALDGRPGRKGLRPPVL